MNPPRERLLLGTDANAPQISARCLVKADWSVAGEGVEVQKCKEILASCMFAGAVFMSEARDESSLHLSAAARSMLCAY